MVYILYYIISSILYLKSVCIGITSNCDWDAELLQEDREGPQLTRVDEVKQTPEFPQVVLHGRA